MNISRSVKYRIVYYGPDKYLAWDNDYKRFVPAGLYLYVTTFNTLEDAMKASRRVKHDYATGWADDIYIESVAAYKY